MGSPQNSQKRHLLLGTVSFTVCFAAWGLISAFAPSFRQKFHLSATQTALLVAVPVLLGALARLPVGMLADRFGGRGVFSILMFFVAVPVAKVLPCGLDCWQVLEKSGERGRNRTFNLLIKSYITEVAA